MEATRKAIFITGAASGIGLATARRFAREGWFVGLADNNRMGLATAADSFGGAASAHVLDVRDADGWERELAAFHIAAGGRLDVLMNNAGIARAGWLENQPLEEIELQLDINLKGVILGCRAGFPLLAETPGSMVVNIASVAALVGSARMPLYVATKFGVRGLSEALDADFSRKGVGVRCIEPWYLDTPILDRDNVRKSLERGHVTIYPVEMAAEGIWKAVHGKGLHHTIGAQAAQAAWAARLVPELLRRRFRRQALGRA